MDESKTIGLPESTSVRRQQVFHVSRCLNFVMKFTSGFLWFLSFLLMVCISYNSASIQYWWWVLFLHLFDWIFNRQFTPNFPPLLSFAGAAPVTSRNRYFAVHFQSLRFWMQYFLSYNYPLILIFFFLWF